MIYWFTVISKWFQHVHILFFAVLFADLLLIAIYSSGPSNAVPTTDYNGNRSTAQAVLLVIFGPFINLYGFYHCCKAFWDYESDIYKVWENSKPSISSRKVWSHLSGPLLAMIYAPPFLWFYSNGIVLFWGEERDFFNTLGFYISILLSLVFGFLFQIKNKEFKRYQKQIIGD